MIGVLSQSPPGLAPWSRAASRRCVLMTLLCPRTWSTLLLACWLVVPPCLMRVRVRGCRDGRALHWPRSRRKGWP